MLFDNYAQNTPHGFCNIVYLTYLLPFLPHEGKDKPLVISSKSIPDGGVASHTVLSFLLSFSGLECPVWNGVGIKGRAPGLTVLGGELLTLM